MSDYDKILRKVVGAIRVHADDMADQNIWDMGREVLKTVPQKELQPTPVNVWPVKVGHNVAVVLPHHGVDYFSAGVVEKGKYGWQIRVANDTRPTPATPAKAMNYLTQASQPWSVPEWLKQMGTPVEGDPNTIVVPVDKIEVNHQVALEELTKASKAQLFPNQTKLLGERYDQLFGEMQEVRRLTGAVSEWDGVGENQRESTVDAVQRLVTERNNLRKEIEELDELCIGIREVVGEPELKLLDAVKAMARENNELRTKVNSTEATGPDSLEIHAANRLLEILKDYRGNTLLAKVHEVVQVAKSNAAMYQSSAEDFSRFRREMREILEAEDEFESDDGYTPGESAQDAARRVVRERDMFEHNSGEKAMAQLSREIRANFADELAEGLERADEDDEQRKFAKWLRSIATKERLEKEMDKL